MGDGDTLAEVYQPGMEEERNASSSSTRSNETSAQITHWMCPLDLRFSQIRMRPEFRDGRSVEDAVEKIEFNRSEDGGWKLVPPFPPVMVTKWRCKLRDADGRPKVDADTQKEILSARERWFTLDNRRLYCLQRAAVAKWPDPVSCEVVEMTEKLEAMDRTLKKFRTADSGRSIRIGDRPATEEENEGLRRWAWRDTVGLHDIVDSDDENTGLAATRARVRRSGNHNRTDAKGKGRGKGKERQNERSNHDCGSDAGFQFRPVANPVASMAIFVIIYCLLRMVVLGVKKYASGGQAPEDVV